MIPLPGSTSTSWFSRRMLRELLLAWGLFWLCFSFHSWQSLSLDPQASMDAGYYHILADRLLDGKGFTEPFIWHHLRHYPQIEHPIDYWMPMGPILYAGAKHLAGPFGDIRFNHLLWSILSVLVFRAARRVTGRPLLALFAWVFMAAGGKFGFYVSTTDNVVFYAVTGFLLLEALTSSLKNGIHQPIGWLVGMACGIITLTRAEGFIFFVMSLAYLLVLRHGRQALIALVVGAAIIAPWVVRNQEVLGTPWPSHPRALWVRTYNDMFEPGAPASFAELRQEGLHKLVLQRVHALQGNLADFFVIPAHLLFVPFWLIGVLRRPRHQKSLFIGFPVLFWLIVSICFPSQSRNGTGLHISAAFFPHVAILSAEAIAWLSTSVARQHHLFRLLGQPPLLLFFMLWTIGLTCAGNSLSSRNFGFESDPYTEVLVKPGFPLPDPIASSDPIRVFVLTGLPGICIPPSQSNDAIEFAQTHGCPSIVLDSRINSFDRARLENPWWETAASSSHLLVLIRKDRP